MVILQILFTTQICRGSFLGYLRETEQETSWRQCPASFFLWGISGLLVQHFPSFPRYWQGKGTPFQIKCWKWLKTLFCPNPSVSPCRFPLVSLFSLPYSSPAPHAPHASLQKKYFSWVSGSPLTQAASTSAFSTEIYQMVALAGLQMWVLVSEPHAFIATTLSSMLTGIDCHNWQNFSFLCISFIHTYLLNPICYAGGPVSLYDGVMDCDLGHSVVSFVLLYCVTRCSKPKASSISERQCSNNMLWC